jgi:hypothetical protein
MSHPLLARVLMDAICCIGFYDYETHETVIRDDSEGITERVVKDIPPAIADLLERSLDECQFVYVPATEDVPASICGWRKEHHAMSDGKSWLDHDYVPLVTI